MNNVREMKNYFVNLHQKFQLNRILNSLIIRYKFRMLEVVSSYRELSCLWLVMLTDITLIPIRIPTKSWYSPLTPKALVERNNSC